MKNSKSIKEKLNNIDYMDMIPSDILKQAKENNILVLFGGSDDLFEIRGAITEELSAYEGFTYKDVENDPDIDKELRDILVENKIELIWCPDDERSWAFKLSIDSKYETFDILEDGEIFCTGVILDISS